jgi:hypothetical protein
MPLAAAAIRGSSAITTRERGFAWGGAGNAEMRDGQRRVLDGADSMSQRIIDIAAGAWLERSFYLRSRCVSTLRA